MRHPFYKGVLLGSVVAAVVMMAGNAFAGSGIGAFFNLGKTNRVNHTSILTGKATKILQVTNSAPGPALGLSTSADSPPMKVSSSKRVLHLDADMVDRLHAVQGGLWLHHGEGGDLLDLRVPSGRAVGLDIEHYGTIRVWYDAGGISWGVFTLDRAISVYMGQDHIQIPAGQTWVGGTNLTYLPQTTLVIGPDYVIDTLPKAVVTIMGAPDPALDGSLAKFYGWGTIESPY